MAAIDFTSNYEDLSTDKGYQFKFHCDKCGNGYMSSFQVSKLGMATSALSAASSLLGGIFGRASSGAYEVQRAVGGSAHDSALKEAVAEIRPKFKQCTRCGKWVCEPICFNHKAGLCEWCAPDLDEEIAAAQADAARDQARQKAQDVNWLKEHGKKIEKPASATCPHCGAKSSGGKFCGECGKPLAAVKRSCPQCSAQFEGQPKFCPECGGKVG